MYRSLLSIKGFKILAKDGEIGKAYDCYFGDQNWIVRYLVVDTGSWLRDRKVLLPSAALLQPDWESRHVPVTMTKEQVEKSPEWNTEKPVHLQYESALHNHYGISPYWFVGEFPEAAQVIAEAERKEEREKKEEKQKYDSHLRSTNEVTGYHIHATDGDIGHVEDFIASDEDWTIRYLVVETRNWLPGTRVLISPSWISDISWTDQKVVVGLTREMIKKSPEYDPHAAINREYETRLYDYYGRPKYWLADDPQKTESR